MSMTRMESASFDELKRLKIDLRRKVTLDYSMICKHTALINKNVTREPKLLQLLHNKLVQ